MDLEKGIRALHIKPYPFGYWEPSTENKQEVAILDTSCRMQEEADSLEMWSWPEKITLRLLWRKVALQPSDTIAQLITSESAHEACAFYNPQVTDRPDFAMNSAASAVEIVYQGIANIYKGKECLMIRGVKDENHRFDIQPDGIVYKREFKVQSNPSLILRRTRLSASSWLVTPPCGIEQAAINLVPLLGYGGYCKPGSRLAEIEQVYARITFKERKTTLDLKGQSYLVEKGITPPLGGVIGKNTYRYMEPFAPEEALSLGLLQSGVIKLKVFNKHESKIYKCIGFAQEDPKTQLFDGLFVPS